MDSYNFKLRIHVDSMTESYHKDFEDFAKSLSKSGQRYMFAYEEDANRDHIQGFFTSDSKRCDTVKSYIKKFIKFSSTIKKLSNAHWSCVLDKEPDTFQNYLHYICKENKVLFSSYTLEEIDQFNKKYWEVNSQIKSDLKKKYNKNSKEKTKDRAEHFASLQQTIEGYLDRSKQIDESSYDLVLDRWVDVGKTSRPYLELGPCINMVINEYSESFFTMSMLEPIIHRLMLKYGGYDYQHTLVRKMENRIAGGIS